MLLVINGFPKSHQTRELEILRSNNQGLIVRYKMTTLTQNEVTVQKARFLSMHLPNSQLWVSPQKSVLPCQTFWVGVPPNCDVNLDIQSFSTQAVDSVFFPAKSIPVTHLKRQLDSSPVDQFFPARLAVISDSGYFRGLKMVQISVFPIQYNKARHRAKLHPSIQFNLHFLKRPGKASTALFDSKDALKSLEGRLVVNWKQARHWRVSRLKKADRIVSDSLRRWYKIPILEEGLYALTYSDLQSLGLDSTVLSEENVHIFYGGGRELPWDVSQTAPQLREIATYFEDTNGDGFLGKNDRLLFYAQSVNGWTFSDIDKRFHHYVHPYTRENVYWLALGGSHRKHMRPFGPSLPDSARSFRQTAPAYFFREPERLNAEKSGIQWMWDRFAGNATRTYPFFLTGVSEKDSCVVRVHFVGKSSNHHTVRIYLNEHFLKSVDIPYMRPVTVEMAGTRLLQDGKNTLKIQQISQLGRKDETYLDWMEIRYNRRLHADSTALIFYSLSKKDENRFELAGFPPSETRIFEVSDPFAVRYCSQFRADSSGNHLYFADYFSTGGPRKYLVVTPSQIKSVSSLEWAADPTRELRNPENAANYLIIAPQSLIASDLIRLAAHRSDPRFWPDSGTQPVVKIVPIEKIYNAFSWGLEDPTAIRNFLKYAYFHWKVAPAYVLLVGDACYDMKHNSPASPPTLVPTHEDGLRATDDWFACVDGDRIPDMIMGRLSVRNKQELRAVVDKIITYDTQLPPGPWHSRVLFVADDANSPTFKAEDSAFGRDTEKLTQDSVVSDLAIRKIYLDAFMPDAAGHKPLAKKELISQINQGISYINFLGHANLEVLTHETIFYTPDDLPLIQNGHRFPLLFAGTCAVGQFDYDRKPCMAEYLTNLQDRGMIATIASTRWTWHAFNYGVNQVFFNTLFQPQNRDRLSIGEALLRAKLHSRYADQRELIELFGDPAQRLALPRPGVALSVSPDTLSLHRRTYITGMISEGGNTYSDFQGKAYLELREPGRLHRTTGYQYILPGRILFSDTVTVAKGTFKNDFFIPALTLSGGSNGQVFCYAWNPKEGVTGRQDTLPMKNDILHSYSEIDSSGPALRVKINGRDVSSGNELIVFPDFQFELELQDAESGLLTTKPDAFPIQLVAQGENEHKQWNITSQITWQDSTTRSGHIRFQCRNLAPGRYTFTVSAYDRALNSTQVRWQGTVVSRRFQLSRVWVYPNPAAEKTFFTFHLSGEAAVEIKIYTLSGRLIQTLTEEADPGFNKVPAEGWDCTDRDGDFLANGVYLYKITAKQELSDFQSASSGQVAQAIGRMIILR
ncbi:MAG: type IX secretion system sortase PorU [Calditrichaeota bacterium]|nr:type IX secretion system sortase PorU [Calditrichota bacterium]